MFSVIGDGCDDKVAAARLGLRESSVHSVRRELHRKLGAQHRGELIRLAAQRGYVRFTAESVQYPGQAILLGFVGLTYLVLVGRHSGGDDRVPIGAALLVLFASTCWAFGSWVQPRLTLPNDAFVMTVHEMWIGGAIMLGLPLGLLGSILMSLFARLVSQPAPGLAYFPLVLTVGYWCVAHFALARSWNHRAARLARWP